MDPQSPPPLLSMSSLPPLESILRQLRRQPTATLDTELLPVSRPMITFNELKNLRFRAQAYFSLFSPVHSLPPELLVEMFTYVAHSLDLEGAGKNFKTDVKRVANGHVLALAHVCVSWRRIVWDTPALWDRLDAMAINQSRVKYGHALTGRLLDFSENRCRDGLFDIRVHIPRGVYCPSDLFPYVMHRISGCKHLHIASLRTEAGIHHLAEVAASNVQSLQSLRLTAQIVPPPGSLDWMADARSLQKLSISASLARQIPAECFQRLRSFTCTTYPQFLREALSVIARLPPALDYRLLVYPSQFDVIPPEETTSYIQSMTLGGGNLHEVKFVSPEEAVWEAFAWIFNSVTLPSLRTISFVKAASTNRTDPLPLPWPHAYFLAMAQRSSFETHLLCLNLVGVDISLEQLEECLDNLRVLESLALGDELQPRQDIDEHQHPTIQLLLQTHPPVQISSSLLDRLIACDRHETLVPRLSTLTLHTKCNFVDTVFTDLLRSRVSLCTSADGGGRFTCHVYVLRGCWTGDGITENRRQRLMNQVSDLRQSGTLRFSFSAL
ncbi:F-box domain-containing protein [Mycena indigotica]|uniref:F-box domain-containing protein n=1 Tax=Mycena indigotica TaxID=2126181 RepID=A0A8H6T2Y0_9AGAR|nr:F-box domain-containing protein [Mycena indigotica]KAF7309397.1 F-box domain-containing protein [Mycena indigotica]